MKLRVLLPTTLLLVLSFITPAPGQTQSKRDPFTSIAAAIEQGRLVEAEKALREILKSSPDDLQALSLLGVVLDSRHLYREAEGAYLKAVKLAPDSPSLLNNLGNHYLARGDAGSAYRTFQKVLALDPTHANANLQTTQLALDHKEYALSLRCLARLPKPEQEAFPVRLLRLRALWGSGDKTGAESLLRELQTEASADVRYRFALAMAFVAMERFAEAEEAFTVVLQADPTNFDILYNMGMSALRADHLERATEALQRAQQIRPGDVDCLVGLARAFMLQHSDSSALPVLARAHEMAPSRSDILLLMAQTSYNEGYYADTVIAYDKYLKLKPDDDIARRERGFALTRSFRVEEGIKELELYVKRHPQDPRGYYKLAAAQSLEDKEQSLESINKVLALDPDFHEARYARGLLYIQLNRPAEAVADLKAYLSIDPENGQALDQMGRALLKVGEPQAAADYLQKAIRKDPENGDLYFQLSRALRALGRAQEMTEALARFKQLGGAKEKMVPAPGLFDFLSLNPEQQQAQSLANLKQAIAQRPSELDLRIKLAELYFKQGKTADALAMIDEVVRISQAPTTLARAARVLLSFNEYSAALPLLETALRQENAPEDLALDYVLAKFHTAGAGEALAKIDQIPASKRNGNYYLLKAQVLDALNRFREAVEALNQALRAAPDRQDFYLQATQFLVKHELYQQTLDLLTQADRFVPNSRELSLTRAIVMELLNHPDDAIRELSRMESLWPEWYQPYLTQGVVLQTTGRPEEARQQLETAIALGAREPTAYYYLSLAIKSLAPGDNDKAYKVVLEGLRWSPGDPFLQAQAGKLALAMNDFSKAQAHLEEAIRLKPEMAEAYWTLSSVYRATGEKEKQLKTLAEVDRLNKLYPQGAASGDQMRDLLFSVGFPDGDRTDTPPK
jgi:tetratricopeptide (TPR) repeat protein